MLLVTHNDRDRQPFEGFEVGDSTSNQLGYENNGCACELTMAV